MAKDNIWEWDTTAASNTDVGGVSIAEGMAPSGVNNAMREMMSQVRELANQGSGIASAGTTSIAATGTSFYVHITGSTGPITSFGTANAGVWRWVVFDSTPTITYNATSMILPGNASITAVAGDTALFVSEGSGNWRCLAYNRDDGTAVTPSANGKHKLWIPAAAMRPQAAGGAASADVTATDYQYYVLDFDQTTPEFAHFNISMPSSSDEGTLTFVPVWTAAGGSAAETVVWQLAARAISNDDVIAGTLSAPVNSTDALIATGDLHRGPESSALTPENTWAANDTLIFRFGRLPGSDTLAADARLLGIELYITTNAAVDVA